MAFSGIVPNVQVVAGAGAGADALERVPSVVVMAAKNIVEITGRNEDAAGGVVDHAVTHAEVGRDARGVEGLGGDAEAPLLVDRAANGVEQRFGAGLEVGEQAGDGI